MLCAINLYNKFGFSTIEIDNIISDNLLTVECV